MHSCIGLEGAVRRETVWTGDKGIPSRECTEGLFVFQLGCPPTRRGAFFPKSKGRRCQWPLPRNGDVLRNQFFSFSLCPGRVCFPPRGNSFLRCLQNSVQGNTPGRPVFIVRHPVLPRNPFAAFLHPRFREDLYPLVGCRLLF